MFLRKRKTFKLNPAWSLQNEEEKPCTNCYITLRNFGICQSWLLQE
jgi:hypothetical protein